MNLTACTPFLEYDVWVRDDKIPSENNYEKVHQGPGGVGAWGGTCTCPDGQTYPVGDNWDNCGSLACVGGTPSACSMVSDPVRAGMKVTCAQASTQPDPQPLAPAEDVYEKAANVGGWGGLCTCPNGQTYNVGDNYDACGSLACVGGTPGECFKVV